MTESNQTLKSAPRSSAKPQKRFGKLCFPSERDKDQRLNLCYSRRRRRGFSCDASGYLWMKYAHSASSEASLTCQHCYYDFDNPFFVENQEKRDNKTAKKLWREGRRDEKKENGLIVHLGFQYFMAANKEASTTYTVL